MLLFSDVSCIIKRALYLLLRQRHVLCVTMLHLYNYLFTLYINAPLTFMDCAFLTIQYLGGGKTTTICSAFLKCISLFFDSQVLNFGTQMALKWHKMCLVLYWAITSKITVSYSWFIIEYTTYSTCSNFHLCPLGSVNTYC